MSIASPKSGISSTPSSILKKTRSLASRLSEINPSVTRVRFALPHSQRVRSILEDFAKTKISRDYENLVCLIRDSELTDDDLSDLLNEASECISILTQDLRLFIEALLSVSWACRDPSVIKKYNSFIVNLLSAHNYYARTVIKRLVRLFLPDPTESEWPDGIPTEIDYNKCWNVHTLMSLLLLVIPMGKEKLMYSITNHFPYYNESTHVHEYYLHNLLWILDYQPHFRPDILELIFSKLVVLDENASKEEIVESADDEAMFVIDENAPKEKIVESADDEAMFAIDEDAKSVKSSETSFTQVNRHSVGHTLDVCLDKMFNYVICECHIIESGEVDWEKTRNLYMHMLPLFDKIILPTYNIHHVQFVMFLMCSFKTTLAEAFLNHLWNKVCNPIMAPVVRQEAVKYIASLVARSNCIPLTMLKGTMHQVAEWIHCYINNHDGLECVNSDVRVHSVFYSICQALFYIVCFRYKDFVKSKEAKENMRFLESLNMARMVISRLNPLRGCQPGLAQNFSAIARQYHLAYCSSIIKRNSRYTLPTIYQDEKGPFDPYILEKSFKKIEPFYLEYQENCESMDVESQDNMLSEEQKDPEVDDLIMKIRRLLIANHKYSHMGVPQDLNSKFKIT